MGSIPPGFEVIDIDSPYVHHGGPIYVRRDPGGNMTFGLLVQERHTNLRRTVHGGVIMLLADVALGFSCALSQDSPRPVATVSLTADFIRTADIGDWIEAEVEVQKAGSRLGFANAFISSGDKRLARISAVFTMVDGEIGR